MSFKSKSGAVLTKDQIGITHATQSATLVSDCNSATDVNVEYTTNASTTNKPTSDSTFLVWCHRINSAMMVQFATIKANTSPLYMRQYNGTWSAWTVVARPIDVYPVGSIYKSTESTNPATYFGGTWTQIATTEPVSVCGSIVRTFEFGQGSQIYEGVLHSLTEIQQLFNDQHGFTPEFISSDREGLNLSVSAFDGDWASSFASTYGLAFYDNKIVMTANTGGGHRVNYTYTYFREIYTFVRSA